MCPWILRSFLLTLILQRAKTFGLQSSLQAGAPTSVSTAWVPSELKMLSLNARDPVSPETEKNAPIVLHSVAVRLRGSHDSQLKL